jgi:hypothetical protein
MPKPVITPPVSPQYLVTGVTITPIVLTATNSPTLWSATNLPYGITIDAATGVISGVSLGGINVGGTPAGTVFSPPTSITASNADGTSDPVTIVWVAGDAPTGSGLWSDFVLTIEHGTRKVTAPGVAPMESGAIFSIARGDVIDLLVGLEKYGVLADLGATVTVEVAPKEFEGEAVLNLTSAVATRVQTSSLAETTRYRVRLTMTPANYAILADYATETEAAMIAPVQIRMIAGSKVLCSDTFLVEILRDSVPD